jgi:hypothetical protein
MMVGGGWAPPLGRVAWSRLDPCGSGTVYSARGNYLFRARCAAPAQKHGLIATMYRGCLYAIMRQLTKCSHMAAVSAGASPSSRLSGTDELPLTDVTI